MAHALAVGESACTLWATPSSALQPPELRRWTMGLTPGGTAGGERGHHVMGSRGVGAWRAGGGGGGAAPRQAGVGTRRRRPQ